MRFSEPEIGGMGEVCRHPRIPADKSKKKRKRRKRRARNVDFLAAFQNSLV